MDAALLSGIWDMGNNIHITVDVHINGSLQLCGKLLHNPSLLGNLIGIELQRGNVTVNLFLKTENLHSSLHLMFPLLQTPQLPSMFINRFNLIDRFVHICFGL